MYISLIVDLRAYQVKYNTLKDNAKILINKQLFMKLNVKEALASARETRALLIGQNVLEQIPEFFNKTFKNKSAVVVCDSTTYAIAGKQVEQYLSKGGIDVHKSFIYHEPKPYAEFSNVLKLEKVLEDLDAIPIAVGSGTINDLTKLTAGRCGLPYMCVATAASMDGYTAFGASITYQGAKQTFSCPAPVGVIADIEIIRRAPYHMTASGYADLFAKITAGADWILADALGVEYIDRTAWSIVQDGLKEALSDPLGARNGSVEAITPLVEGLILGGFAMQWSQSSRPASGAEHQFSHLWNMEHHTHNGDIPSHGFQVGIATLAITRLYEKMLETPFENLNVERCCEQWPQWTELEQKVIEQFQNTDFLETAISQSRVKYIDKQALGIHLNKFKAGWPQLRSQLKNQLVPSEEVSKKLMAVGAPVNPEEIGITSERMKASFSRAQYIRSRYTILDIAIRTGYLEKWLNEIY